MATWTDLTNQQIGHKKPITLQQGRALRDNPIAMGEGAAGAPSIGGGMARVQANFEVGCYVMAASGDVELGQVVAGSSLSASSGLRSVVYRDSTASTTRTYLSGALFSTLSGSWRSCGYVAASSPVGDGAAASTLFQRIA